ncbi:MAG TPA: hypothetical protein VML55_18935 [Planctomycetaceae bacterium]|nr:hypothetical protein [Planctomycetaceae bacterium]
MSFFPLALALTVGSARDAAIPADRPSIVLVIGAEGSPEYGREFQTWAARWREAADRAGAVWSVIGDEDTPRPDDSTSDRVRLHGALHAARRDSPHPLWLVLIGHGTWDGRAARFNLRGPDVSAAELHEWLPAGERPTIVINCASASGPFIDRLAAPGRMVITATKSGSEVNFARFGDALSAAIADPAADLDKDGQTSLLEAWLLASRQTEEFYKSAGRLPTEHALLDDTGDGRGVRPDAFIGVRPVQRPADGQPSDGYRAHQVHFVPSTDEQRLAPELRERRDRLELELFDLRDRKPQLAEDEYHRRLEAILVELATLYESAGKR